MSILRDCSLGLCGLRIVESLMEASKTMNGNLQMLKGFLEHSGDCKIPCHLTRTRPWGLFDSSSIWDISLGVANSG